jgi:hypothetical protein
LQESDVPALAQEAADEFRTATMNEPIARYKGKPVGRLVVNLVIKTETGGQTLLQLERLALRLENVIL